MRFSFLALAGVLLCQPALAASIKDYLDAARSYDGALDSGVAAVQAENKALEEKYNASAAGVDKLAQSLTPAAREKVDLDAIKKGFLDRKNGLVNEIQIGASTVEGYRAKIAQLKADLGKIQAEYLQAGDKPDYQEFLEEKAKKRMQAFNQEATALRKLLTYDRKGTRESRLRTYDFSEQTGALYRDALSKSIRYEGCEEPTRRMGGLPNDFTKVNTQDPALWNFVLASGKEKLAFNCRRIRIGTPSVGYDKSGHKVNFVWKYTIDPVFMNETIYAKEDPWQVIADAAQKWNGNSEIAAKVKRAASRAAAEDAGEEASGGADAR